MPIKFFCNGCGKEIFRGIDKNQDVNLQDFEKNIICSDCLIEKTPELARLILPRRELNGYVVINIDGKSHQEEIDGNELFCSELYKAHREQRNPAQTLLHLVELASSHLEALKKLDPAWCKNKKL